ncbi:hypothetical protein SSTU70S_02957 [Stutzerimonas stutzeri]
MAADTSAIARSEKIAFSPLLAGISDTSNCVFDSCAPRAKTAASLEVRSAGSRRWEVIPVM